MDGFQIDTVSVLAKDGQEFVIYGQYKKCHDVRKFRNLFFITLNK
jgi:uncharacterized protein (UPF0179 family)